MKKRRNTPVLQKYIEHIHKTNLYKVMNGEQVNCSAKSINQTLTYRLILVTTPPQEKTNTTVLLHHITDTFTLYLPFFLSCCTVVE